MPKRFTERYREPDLVRWSDVPGLFVAFGIALLIGLVTGLLWIAWKLFEVHVLTSRPMNPTVADIPAKSLESAKRQFVELYGSALVMNTYLKIAVVLLALVALALVGLNFRTVATYANVKPLVVRIDDVGRAEAVQYDATAYQPQPPELRYFLRSEEHTSE